MWVIESCFKTSALSLIWKWQSSGGNELNMCFHDRIFHPFGVVWRRRKRTAAVCWLCPASPPPEEQARSGVDPRRGWQVTLLMSAFFFFLEVRAQQDWKHSPHQPVDLKYLPWRPVERGGRFHKKFCWHLHVSTSITQQTSAKSFPSDGLPASYSLSDLHVPFIPSSYLLYDLAVQQVHPESRAEEGGRPPWVWGPGTSFLWRPNAPRIKHFGHKDLLK